jgi:hypothetical protein
MISLEDRKAFRVPKKLAELILPRIDSVFRK